MTGCKPLHFTEAAAPAVQAGARDFNEKVASVVQIFVAHAKQLVRRAATTSFASAIVTGSNALLELWPISVPEPCMTSTSLLPSVLSLGLGGWRLTVFL